MSANRSKIKEQMPKGTQIQSNKGKKKKEKMNQNLRRLGQKKAK
jgi:hypothetical protein